MAARQGPLDQNGIGPIATRLSCLSAGGALVGPAGWRRIRMVAAAGAILKIWLIVLAIALVALLCAISFQAPGLWTIQETCLTC